MTGVCSVGRGLRGTGDLTRGDCRMGGVWIGRDCIIILFLTRCVHLLVAYIYIVREGEYYIVSIESHAISMPRHICIYLSKVRLGFSSNHCQVECTSVFNNDHESRLCST